MHHFNGTHLPNFDFLLFLVFVFHTDPKTMGPFVVRLAVTTTATSHLEEMPMTTGDEVVEAVAEAFATIVVQEDLTIVVVEVAEDLTDEEAVALTTTEDLIAVAAVDSRIEVAGADSTTEGAAAGEEEAGAAATTLRAVIEMVDALIDEGATTTTVDLIEVQDLDHKPRLVLDLDCSSNPAQRLFLRVKTRQNQKVYRR